MGCSMSHPLVSVIVPSYNHESYIIETLDSIKSQTYNNIELIIIDDGSIDKTNVFIKAWCDDNSMEFQKILHVQKKNGGVSSALNHGIERSSGNYITFCASDDIFAKEKVSKMVNFLERNKKIKAIATDAHLIDANSNLISPSAIRSRHFVSTNFVNKLAANDLVYFWCVFGPCQFFHKSIFEIYGKFDETLVIEDRDFWLRILHNDICHFFPEPLSYYRVHKNSSTYQTLGKRGKRNRNDFALSCIKNAHNYRGLKRLFLETYRIDRLVWLSAQKIGFKGYLWSIFRSTFNRFIQLMIWRRL